MRGTNVIDVPVELEAIQQGVTQALAKQFQAHLESCTHPYGDGNSSSRIIDCLESMAINDRLLIKRLTL